MNGMAICGQSIIASRSNIVDYTGYRCKKCGELKWQCLCWMWTMTKIEWILYNTHKLDVYAFIVVKSACVSVINLVRRSMHCLSGMCGLKLLEKMDRK